MSHHHQGDRAVGAGLAETSWEDSQLYRVLREAPLVIDKLPAEDRASLAATCWGALETVLRDSRAVLKVHPDDPVLAALAQRAKGGPCAGEVTLCGVRVPAKDAGALLYAARRLGPDLSVLVADSIGDFSWIVPDDIAPDEFVWDEDIYLSITQAHHLKGNREEATLAWIKLISLLAGADGETRVTGLTLPDLWGRTAAELHAVAEVLRTPAMRNSLRFLEVEVHVRQVFFAVPRKAAEALHEAARDLSALRHLELRNIPVSWACLIDQYSCPTTLDLRAITPWELSSGQREFEAFLDAVERAANLRNLKLPGEVHSSLYRAGLRPRAPPVGLEELGLSSSQPLRWWKATGLRSLKLDSWQESPGFGVWGRLAELVGREKKLQRLDIELMAGPPPPPELLVPFFSALEQSTVEELVFHVPGPRTPGEPSQALTAAAVSAINKGALRELTLLSKTTASSILDWTAVASALGHNTTLRKLVLTPVVFTAAYVPAAMGGLLSRNTSLVELHMISCAIGPEGLRELFRGLGENRTLQVLRYDGGVLRYDGGVLVEDGDEQLRELMDAMYGGDRHEGRQLHTLDICLSFGEHGVRSVAAVLENELPSKMRRLVLRSDRYCGRALEALAWTLRRNRSLVSLKLRVDVEDSTRGLESLAASLRDNTTLRHFDFQPHSVWCSNNNALAKQLLHAQRYAIAQRQLDRQGCCA